MSDPTAAALKLATIILVAGLCSLLFWLLLRAEKAQRRYRRKLTRMERELAGIKHWDESDLATRFFRASPRTGPLPRFPTMRLDDFEAVSGEQETRNLRHVEFPLVLDTKTRRLPRS